MRDSRPAYKRDRPYSLVGSQLRSLRNGKQSEQWFTPARGSQHGGSGNFVNDPQRASEEGKKGRKQSHQGSEISQNNTEESKQGGSGNFANDHEKALSLRGELQLGVTHQAEREYTHFQQLQAAAFRDRTTVASPSRPGRTFPTRSAVLA